MRRQQLIDGLVDFYAELTGSRTVRVTYDETVRAYLVEGTRIATHSIPRGQVRALLAGRRARMTKPPPDPNREPWCADGAHVWVVADDPRRESCTRCPTWQWRTDLTPIAHDVVLLARAAIPEEVSDESWRVIERLAAMALTAVNDSWRIRHEAHDRAIKRELAREAAEARETDG